jgi:hypothetical protein
MYDAQKAYEEHHPTSNTTMFAANKIMEYLTTVRISDRLWHGALENFLINWQEQFRRCEHLEPAASHYKDKQKLAMLQVTIHPLRELQQVKNTVLLIKQANNGKDIMYDEYVQLLAHAASDYNNILIKMKVTDMYIYMIFMKIPTTHRRKPLLSMNLLTLILLLIQYKPMLLTAALHPIEVIITTKFACPKIDGLALMIRPRQFGIA